MSSHHDVIRQFLEAQPQWLSHDVRYLRVADSDEPEPCLSTTAMKAFIAWAEQQGMVGKPERVPDLVQLLDDLPEIHRAHDSGICNPETCPICRAQAGDR
jgi:hypothetical protein